METPCKNEDDCSTPTWCRGKSLCPKLEVKETLSSESSDSISFFLFLAESGLRAMSANDKPGCRKRLKSIRNAARKILSLPQKADPGSAMSLPILKTELPASSGRMTRLIQRLFVQRSQMTPHQKDREQGKLILECSEIIGGAVLSIAHLEACMEDGATIRRQDGKWHIFAADGNGIKCRATFEDLVTDLPPLKDVPTLEGDVSGFFGGGDFTRNLSTQLP